MSPTTLRTHEAIILAGGMGTRLRGSIGELPKPMAPVAGRPFLAWQLDALERRGIRQVILSVGYRREAIEAHFGDRHATLSIAYAKEEVPLGTGGAIAAAMRMVQGPAAFVLNGDTYLRAPLRALESAGGDFSVLVARVEDAGRFGTVVVSEGLVTGFREKAAGGAGLVNSGVYWIAKSVMAAAGLPEKFSFEKDFMEPRAASLAIRAVVTDEPFIDIGVPETLAAADTVIPALAAADLPPYA
jgi:D-glycero-alpha-D-manno-heptose 1-phosphate guanylyltransferase